MAGEREDLADVALPICFVPVQPQRVVLSRVATTYHSGMNGHTDRDSQRPQVSSNSPLWRVEVVSVLESCKKALLILKPAKAVLSSMYRY